MNKKVKVTDKESKQLHNMSKNMQRFLAETKKIPCKIVNLNKGKTEKKEESDEEIDVPGIYEIHGTQRQKGSKKFPWEIIFDLDDIDDNSRPRRHLLLGKDKIDFIVTTNAQLMFLLDFYVPTVVKPTVVKKEEKPKVEANA